MSNESKEGKPIKNVYNGAIWGSGGIDLSENRAKVDILAGPQKMFSSKRSKSISKGRKKR